MAIRTSAQEEKLATLQSVMNVIAILNQGRPRGESGRREFDLRPLLPIVDQQSIEEEAWNTFLTINVSPITEQ